jgi:hypothetical protein
MYTLQGTEPAQPHLPENKHIRSLWSRYLPMGDAQAIGNMMTLESRLQQAVTHTEPFRKHFTSTYLPSKPSCMCDSKYVCHFHLLQFNKLISTFLYIICIFLFNLKTLMTFLVYDCWTELFIP